MGDQKFSQEWWNGIAKVMLYFVFICIGIVVSIAMEVEQVFMSKKRIILRVIFSLCAGAICSFACYYSKIAQWIVAILVPCVTILGQEFFKWLVSGGWNIIKNYLANKVNKTQNSKN